MKLVQENKSLAKKFIYVGKSKMGLSVGSISSQSSASTVSSSSLSLGSTEGLTAEQKRKIARIEADYAAKKISKTQQDLEIAAVRASGVKSKKSVSKAKESKPSEEPQGIFSTKAKTLSRSELSKQLFELLKNKDKGILTESHVNDFIDNLKNTLGKYPGALVDKTL